MSFPTRKTLIKLTAVIIGTCAVCGAIFALIDAGCQALVGLL